MLSFLTDKRLRSSLVGYPVVGDFDGDGFDDLAIGMPGAATNDGRVIVLFGSVSGLQLGGRETKDFSEAGARFAIKAR